MGNRGYNGDLAIKMVTVPTRMVVEWGYNGCFQDKIDHDLTPRRQWNEGLDWAPNDPKVSVVQA